MSDQKYMLEVKNLNLAFPLRVYKVSTIRDFFVSTLKNPMSLFKEQPFFHALKDINFKVSPGERIGLLGVNGAGKSTICRCISGFYTPPGGEIVRNGNVRALFESSLAMFPELSGRENLKVLADIFYDPEKHDIPKIIQESIEFSELKGFIDVPIKTYSKGMLLRLSLSLLSAVPADILILDEVFDGADEFFREKLATRIRNLIKNSGVVIFVSHQDHHLLEVCNRVLLINNGSIIFDGSPEESLKVYRQKFATVSDKEI